MKLYEFFDLAIQSTVIVCYYDYDCEERIIIDKEQAECADIQYVYVENGEIWVEVNEEDVEV